MSWSDRTSQLDGRWSERALFSNASILDVGDVTCRKKGGHSGTTGGKLTQRRRSVRLTLLSTDAAGCPVRILFPPTGMTSKASLLLAEELECRGEGLHGINWGIWGGKLVAQLGNTTNSITD